jgi:geranylgeranyl pyrophosphate synthase
MVAQRKELNEFEVVEDLLFSDERRLHQEVGRFLAFAARHDANLVAQLKPILNVSGKRIRPLLPFWLMRAFDLEAREEAVARVAAVTLVLHSAAIVIDDIEDGSLERQAQATLHLRNGLAPTLNSASLLIFTALEYLQDPSLMAMTVEAISRCHLGQAMDLAFGDPRVAGPLLDGSDADRRERWTSCTRYKTSQLMEWSVRATAQVLGLGHDTVEKLASALVEYGIGYQILDDVKNLRPDLVGAKAYEDLPRGLRNWVCLELLAMLDETERAQARSLYGGFAFTGFVRMHRGLDTAVEQSMIAARAHLASAERALSDATCGREMDYLSSLLDRPLEDLRG